MVLTTATSPAAGVALKGASSPSGVAPGGGVPRHAAELPRGLGRRGAGDAEEGGGQLCAGGLRVAGASGAARAQRARVFFPFFFFFFSFLFPFFCFFRVSGGLRSADHRVRVFFLAVDSCVFVWLP